MGSMDGGGEVLTAEEAMMHYFQRTHLSTAAIDPGTLQLRFPNGLVGSLHNDAESVLAVDLIRVAGDSYEDVEHGRLSRDFVFMLGIAVGAAMQRDGLVPGDLTDAVNAIEGQNQQIGATA